jgi:hypothetical protein
MLTPSQQRQRTMLTPSQQRSEKKAADDADAIAAEIGEESTKFVVHAWQMRHSRLSLSATTTSTKPFSIVTATTTSTKPLQLCSRTPDALPCDLDDLSKQGVWLVPSFRSGIVCHGSV